MFWNVVRDRQFCGKKFLRQHPFLVDSGEKETFFVADFYCAEAKLIVEIDGMIHQYHKEDDILREQILRERGLKIVRFTNIEVEQHMDDVLAVLNDVLLNSTPRPPSLPRREGGVRGMSSRTKEFK